MASILYWLAIALRAMRHGDFKPGQVMVLAGRRSAAITAPINHDTCARGRSANPMKYLFGSEKFNFGPDRR